VWSAASSGVASGRARNEASRPDRHVPTDLSPKAEKLIEAIARAQELAERYEESIGLLDYDLARARAGLEKLAAINRIYDRLDTLEQEHRTELGEMRELLDGFHKSLEGAEAKRMATSHKVKRGLEVLNDRVLLIEQKTVS
jgi:hypothetical protein